MPGQSARENGKLGGRPPGRKNNATLEKEAVLKAFRDRVLKSADLLFNAQSSLAQGQQFLYRIDTEILKDGKKSKSKPVLVTDPDEIARFLDGEFGEGESANTETEYYYMTTKEPNNMAADSLLDRTFGTAVKVTEVTGKDGKDLFTNSEEVSKLTSMLNEIHRGTSLPGDGGTSSSVDKEVSN